MQRIKSEDALSPDRNLWHAQDWPPGSKPSPETYPGPSAITKWVCTFNCKVLRCPSVTSRSGGTTCSEQQQTVTLQTTAQVLFDVLTDLSKRGLSFKLTTRLALLVRLPLQHPLALARAAAVAHSVRRLSCDAGVVLGPHIKPLCRPQ